VSFPVCQRQTSKNTGISRFFTKTCIVIHDALKYTIHLQDIVTPPSMALCDIPSILGHKKANTLAKCICLSLLYYVLLNVIHLKLTRRLMAHCGFRFFTFCTARTFTARFLRSPPSHLQWFRHFS